MNNPLLGDHKPSSNWYTPGYIWEKIYKTFDSEKVYDPCPIKGFGGLKKDWNYQNVYVNPPIPARDWAEYTIKQFEKFDNNVIYACYSEPVIYQFPEILVNPNAVFVLVRKRIRWIDSETMKISTKPRNYNAFVLLTHRNSVKQRFKENFEDLGTVMKALKV